MQENRKGTELSPPNNTWIYDRILGRIMKGFEFHRSGVHYICVNIILE